MRCRGLGRHKGKVAMWAKLAAAASLFCGVLGFLMGPGAAWAEDRKTKIITFESSGAISTGTSYSSGFLVENYSEGVLLVNVSAKSGTPIFSLVIQTSDDNSTYYYQSTLENITETGTTAYEVTNFGKYMRLKEVVSGVTSVTAEIKGVFKN